MDGLPAELKAAITELEKHYEQFVRHPVGANGYLVFARNKISGADVAIKFYSGEPGARRHDEPRLLQAIQSPNVLPIIDARNLSDEWAFFLTKRCFEGDLDKYIGTKPSVYQAIDVAIGICTGVTAIHASNMVHRDLKPGNIVVNGGVPQIADFGSVKRLAENEADVAASQHSVLYRPPEAFSTGRYGYQGDVYQIGLVTYQLLGGDLPYDAVHHFSARDLKEYAKLNSVFEKSKFEDQVIHRRAMTAKLLDFSTLPPWIDNGAKRALKSMTRPSLGDRLGNMADVAAVLTRVRARALNWRWSNDVARLELPDRIIELRPLGNGLYEPLQSKEGPFRRIPSTRNASLSQLVSARP